MRLEEGVEVGEVGWLYPFGSLTFLCYHPVSWGQEGTQSCWVGDGLLVVWGHQLLLDLLQRSCGPQSKETWRKVPDMVSDPEAGVLCGVSLT